MWSNLLLIFCFWRKVDHLLIWNQYLFKFFKNSNVPLIIKVKMLGGGGISKSICDVVLKKTKDIVTSYKFLAMFINGISTSHHIQSWISSAACVCCTRMKEGANIINFGRGLRKGRSWSSISKIILDALLNLEVWHKLT